ncbi:MAG: hypothetical protein ACRDLY_13065, partial [Thermoleophilaceae bacterium]
AWLLAWVVAQLLVLGLLVAAVVARAARQAGTLPPGRLQLAGYLGLALLLLTPWGWLAVAVPALGWLALADFALLLVVPVALLVLVEVGELVADVVGFVLEKLTRLARGRRDGLVLASA